jgi:hypothetical protein
MISKWLKNASTDDFANTVQQFKSGIGCQSQITTNIYRVSVAKSCTH